MLDEERHAGVDVGVDEQVVVLEHEQKLVIELCELVEQRRQHDLGRVDAADAERRPRAVAERRDDRAKSLDHIGPEPDRVVSVVDVEPGERSALAGVGGPLGQERGLPLDP